MASAEFWTSVTDYLLAAQCAVYAMVLGRSLRGFETGLFAAWPAVFVFSSFAALTGAWVHAARVSGAAPAPWLWQAVLYSVLGASLSMLAAAAGSWAAPSWKKTVLVLGAFKTIFFAVLLTQAPEFRWALLDYAINLMAVLGAALACFRSPGARWIAAGIAVCFAAAFVQQSSLALSEALNHNVLYHLIQLGAFHLLFEGSRRLMRREKGI